MSAIFKSSGVTVAQISDASTSGRAILKTASATPGISHVGFIVMDDAGTVTITDNTRVGPLIQSPVTSLTLDVNNIPTALS